MSLLTRANEGSQENLPIVCSTSEYKSSICRRYKLFFRETRTIAEFASFRTISSRQFSSLIRSYFFSNENVSKNVLSFRQKKEQKKKRELIHTCIFCQETFFFSNISKSRINSKKYRDLQKLSCVFLCYLNTREKLFRFFRKIPLLSLSGERACENTVISFSSRNTRSVHFCVYFHGTHGQCVRAFYFPLYSTVIPLKKQHF